MDVTKRSSQARRAAADSLVSWNVPLRARATATASASTTRCMRILRHGRSQTVRTARRKSSIVRSPVDGRGLSGRLSAWEGAVRDACRHLHARRHLARGSRGPRTMNALPSKRCFTRARLPLRLLLVLDNVSRHKTPSCVLWQLAHGVMPLYTPLGGSWLYMAESIQRVLVHRVPDRHQPTSPAEVIAWLEDTTHGWNASPTLFVWGGPDASARPGPPAPSHPRRLRAGTTRPLRRLTTFGQRRRSRQTAHQRAACRSGGHSAEAAMWRGAPQAEIGRWDG